MVLSFINLYNGLNNKNNDAKELDYDIISLNFHEKDDKRINKNLFYEIIEGKDNINSAILNISKELSDIVIHISYLREDIKNNIQKYGIVGTKKIVLDNLSEFFIKNYSDNKDWGYQSNFIINHYENYISSLFTSILILSPSINFCAKINFDNGFSIICLITRFRGRAPYIGLNPRVARNSLAS